MQRSGTEENWTRIIQHPQPKREITYMTNIQNTKKTYVNRVSIYFPKEGHSATETELKLYEHTKGETLQKLWHQKQATENHNKTTARNGQQWITVGGGLKLVFCAQPEGYKTFSWLFSSHDNPLTRQWINTVNK